MRRVLVALFFSLLLPSPASATWSIVAIDRNTGRMVISSATCAATGPHQLKRLQAIVVPGIGIAAAQAGVDRTHENQRLIYAELMKGTDPTRIIQMLENDPQIERRQFGIIDIQGRTAGRTGSGNSAAAIDIQGISADGIIYSVQGNIIMSEEALQEAAHIMENDRSPIIDRVMLAMEKTDEMGGDSRCTCGREPLPLQFAQCTGKTSHVAYIIAADPSDAQGTFVENHNENMRTPYNEGEHHLYLMVVPTNTLPHEDANPMRTLRMRYDAWKERQGM